MKSTTILTVSVLTMALAQPLMADEARVAGYTAKLRSARVAEIPRETARLVTAENAETRLAAAGEAVTAAVTLNGPSAPLVAGSVAKAAPETAATAAAAAVKQQPKLAGAIAKATVSAAPSQAEAIVGAMCRAQPTAFYAIGVSAAQAAPRSADKILPAITAAVPALKPLVARSQAQFAAAKRTASLALVLKHTEDMLAALSRESKEAPEAFLAAHTETTMSARLASSAMIMPPPPVMLPPFVPGGGTPGEILPAGTPEVSPAGRVYSGP